MCVALRVRVLAVLAATMRMFQDEMVATSWLMVTIEAVEHSIAVYAGGQGWSASGSSAQPIRAAGLRDSWARPATKLKMLLIANESQASRAGSGANGGGTDAGGHWVTPQAFAGQDVWTIWARPSWARPPAKPKGLLDANEQRDPRVGSDANGGGTNSSGAVCSGAADSGAVDRAQLAVLQLAGVQIVVVQTLAQLVAMQQAGVQDRTAHGR